MVTRLRATSYQISASDPPGLGIFVANLIIVGVTSDIDQGVPLQSLRHNLETRRATDTQAISAAVLLPALRRKGASSGSRSFMDLFFLKACSTALLQTRHGQHL